MREIKVGRVRSAARAFEPRAQLVLAILALLFTSSFASAATYGDVEVTIKNESRGSAFHGYTEIEFLVVNRSAQASHDVRLTYPKSSYSYGGDDLRAISRTVTVEAGKSVRAVLAYPVRIDVSGSGSGTGVAIDGREQEEAIRVGSGSSSRGSYRSSGAELNALYSKTIDTRFPDWVSLTHRTLQSGGKIPSSVDVEVVRADQAVDQWSTNWLGYTRYDGVVVTAADLRIMPAEVRNAIGQYVECGGSLFVLGRDPVLPGPWKLRSDPDRPVSVATPGFGQCIVTDQVDLSAKPDPVLGPVLESWNATAAPWLRLGTAGQANRAFPVVEDVGIPVRGLLFLMIVFAVVIGPVNLMVLTRMKRKLWLFWTVPVISFLTCLTVFGYMALTEGWRGQSRIEGLTVLDENSRRASTVGWMGFYSPVLPSGGLHFSSETELTYRTGLDSYSYRARGSSGSSLTIDWTHEQHLASGWMTPRVPAHFIFRKSELRRERMTIARGADGALEAVNGLGADLTEFWYLDENGHLFHADAIPAGGRVTLKPDPGAVPAVRKKPLRSVYSGEWSKLPETMKYDAETLLAPRTYLGLMEAAPFLDDALPGASVRKTRSVVYGILKEG